jgi:nucleoid DNA-binding protein
LNPKKPKTLLGNLYLELDIDKNLVSDIVDFYWLNVRKSITQISYPRIGIENLGSFELKIKSLQNTIDKYQNALDKTDTSNFRKYSKYMAIKNRIEVLENSKSVILEEKQRKQQIKINRYGNTPGSLEEERKDS